MVLRSEPTTSVDLNWWPQLSSKKMLQSYESQNFKAFKVVDWTGNSICLSLNTKLMMHIATNSLHRVSDCSCRRDIVMQMVHDVLQSQNVLQTVWFPLSLRTVFLFFFQQITSNSWDHCDMIGTERYEEIDAVCARPQVGRALELECKRRKRSTGLRNWVHWLSANQWSCHNVATMLPQITCVTMVCLALPDTYMSYISAEFSMLDALWCTGFLSYVSKAARPSITMCFPQVEVYQCHHGRNHNGVWHWQRVED